MLNNMFSQQFGPVQSHRLLSQVSSQQCHSLSKTTKLILLDSLLQEVCISSGSDGSLTLSSLGLSVCLSQSQTYFFGAKESPLTIGAYGKQIKHSSPVVPVSVSPSPQHPPPSVVVKMAVRCLQLEKWKRNVLLRGFSIYLIKKGYISSIISTLDLY